jgi:hypothetical protein
MDFCSLRFEGISDERHNWIFKTVCQTIHATDIRQLNGVGKLWD